MCVSPKKLDNTTTTLVCIPPGGCLGLFSPLSFASLFPFYDGFVLSVDSHLSSLCVLLQQVSLMLCYWDLQWNPFDFIIFIAFIHMRNIISWSSCLWLSESFWMIFFSSQFPFESFASLSFHHIRARLNCARNQKITKSFFSLSLPRLSST